MNTEPSVAVIILNWNGFEDTVECLESLRASTYKNFQVVLVDNGSDNNEGTRLKETFPEVHLIENKENRGFAGGNNDGMNWALQNGFKYIVNLNNDCIVEPDWLAQLIAGVLSVNADFASSRIMYYPEKDLICSDGDAILPDGSGVVERQFQTFNGSLSLRPIFSACGAASIYTARSLEAVKINNNQFFDELYFAYFEDIDLGIRLNAKSYKGFCVPQAVVYHKGSQSAGTKSFFTVYHLERNRILNELLNFPVLLILLGELFYVYKVFFRRMYGSLKKKSTPPKKSQKAEKINSLKIMYESRKWILNNLIIIIKNRLKRKANGMINYRIMKFLNWNCMVLFKNNRAA